MINEFLILELSLFGIVSATTTIRIVESQTFALRLLLLEKAGKKITCCSLLLRRVIE